MVPMMDAFENPRDFNGEAKSRSKLGSGDSLRALLLSEINSAQGIANRQAGIVEAASCDPSTKIIDEEFLTSACVMVHTSESGKLRANLD